jgi:hypothetical protein
MLAGKVDFDAFCKRLAAESKAADWRMHNARRSSIACDRYVDLVWDLGRQFVDCQSRDEANNSGRGARCDNRQIVIRERRRVG